MVHFFFVSLAINIIGQYSLNIPSAVCTEEMNHQWKALQFALGHITTFVYTLCAYAHYFLEIKMWNISCTQAKNFCLYIKVWKDLQQSGMSLDVI